MTVIPSTPGNEHLIAKILSRIRTKRRITFAEFMEMALYDPEFGYYSCGRETVGTGGDFVTSPTMHPAFGRTIARWLESRWVEMGSPESFDVVEMGAGKGLLTSVILQHLVESNPRFVEAIRYFIVEKGVVNPPSREIEVYADLSDQPDQSVRGVIFSNELIDAFPVHLVTVEGGLLKEIYVSERDGRFIEEFGDPSTPEIPAYFERLGIELAEGYRTEVNLRALDWMRQVGEKLAEGFVLTIDYGYMANEYYSPEHRRGTLLCYHRQTFSEDPYIRISEQDITAHVDFTSLMNAGKEAGLQVSQLTTQGDFLMCNGIQEYIGVEGGRRAVMALLDPRGMGGFRVLVQSVGT